MAECMTEETLKILCLGVGREYNKKYSKENKFEDYHLNNAEQNFHSFTQHITCK